MREKSYQSYSLSNYTSIPQIDGLTKEEKEIIHIVGSVLPFKTNNYVTEELIDWSKTEDDPIYTLNFPRKEMLRKKHYTIVKDFLKKSPSKEQVTAVINRIRTQLNPNPSGQEHNIPLLDGKRLSGTQHKYRETALFFPSQGQTCHAYCTFCFRWPQFSGLQNMKFSSKESESFFRYLKIHPKITDVLFTGGDPMTMTANILSSYIEPLLEKDFNHIRTIRIGTKALAYWPYRFLTDKDSDDILQLFKKVVKAGKNLSIMAHFNHPVELSTDAVKTAISRILSTGAQIRTQSPLLKNINNKPEIWSKMWRQQVDLNCIPYYMFVERDTGAKHYFQIPLEQCWQIFRKAYRKVSGICRTVRGPIMSATPGKIQILGVSEIRGEKVFVLRFIQGRNPEWVNIPFFAEYDEKATWLNHLKPAFGEEKFFFEKYLGNYFRESFE